MTFKPEDHPRAPDGTFTEHLHGEAADVTLTAPAGPEAVLESVISRFDELSGIPDRLRARMEGRDAAEVLAELDAENHGGRCARDAKNYTFNPAWCDDCLVARAVEYQLRPTPDPQVYGVIPGPAVQHELSGSGYSEPGTTGFTGDEVFESAVRTLLKAPDGSEVIVRHTADPVDWTQDFPDEIFISAGAQRAVYRNMGALMCALDISSRPDTETKVRQFCADSTAPGPHYYGNAAVYHYTEDQQATPVFGWPMLVNDSGRGKELNVLLRDASDTWIPLEDIVDVLPTSETGEVPRA